MPQTDPCRRSARRAVRAPGRLRWPVGEVRVGTSGWRYASWRGAWYPPGLPQRRELEHLASRLRTVEINGSFYALQRPESYAR